MNQIIPQDNHNLVLHEEYKPNVLKEKIVDSVFSLTTEQSIKTIEPLLLSQKEKIQLANKLILSEIQELTPQQFPVLCQMRQDPSKLNRLMTMVLGMLLKEPSPIGSILALLESDLG